MTKKLNILMCRQGPYPDVGGVASHMETLTQGLQEVGYETTILSQSDIPKRLLYLAIDPLTFLQQRVDSYLLKSWGWMLVRQHIKFCLAWLTRKHLKEQKFDLFHAHDVLSFNAILPIAKRLSIPIVLTIHDYLYLGMIGTPSVKDGSFVADWCKKEERKSFEKADYLIAVDSGCRKYAEDFGRQDGKIELIFNCPNKEFFSITPELRLSKRKEKGIKEDAVVILCPRRLATKNGVEVLVEAAKHLKGYSQVQIILAGDGIEREQIIKTIQANRLESIISVLGNQGRQQIFDLHCLADIVVVPSITWQGLQEATSISALEAMAAGIPVIASDIGGLSELIENGQNGILVPEQSPEILAKEIINLIKNRELREKIGKAGASYASQHFHPFNHTQKVMAVYQKVLR